MACMAALRVGRRSLRLPASLTLPGCPSASSLKRTSGTGPPSEPGPFSPGDDRDDTPCFLGSASGSMASSCICCITWFDMASV
uniref:Uncharacterized protein n=1 Tax=Ixodes ricinus TaxID=34613 RepID=A0A6B0U9G3_IXORI